MISPCPICGNPHLCISRRGIGPARVEKKNGRRKTVYAAIAFGVWCGTCHTSIVRVVEDGQTQASVKRAVTALWERRCNSTALNDYGLKPCPLCGGEHVIPGIETEQNGYEHEVLECIDCGYQLAPNAMRQYSPVEMEFEALARMWNRRGTVMDWELKFWLDRGYEPPKVKDEKQNTSKTVIPNKPIGNILYNLDN